MSLALKRRPRGAALTLSTAIGHPNLRPEAATRSFVLLLLGAALLGFLVRASFVLSSDFPLNDGGLFYVMVQDLQRSHYLLPKTMSYNAAHIPYAYPPLPFYLAAAVTDLTPLSLIGALRFLPLTVSTLTIAAFAFLARSMLSSRTAVVAATFAFALLPRTSMWMIMGGGLTRSLGFLFAIMALNQAYLLYRRGGRRHVALTTLLAALTVLSHLKMASFLAAGIAVLLVAHGRTRTGLANSALVLAGTVVLTAPWWGTVAAWHGLGPFLAAGRSRPVVSWEAPIKLIVFDVTNEPMFALLGFLGFLGALACVANRRFLIPTWLLVVGAVAPWILATVVAVPLALLIGIGIADVVVPLLSRPYLLDGSLVRQESAGCSEPRRAARGWLPAAVLGLLLCYSTLSALLVVPFLMKGLSADERAAMEWAAHNTPPASQFLVITGDTWATDSVSEWFPVLSHRVSVATAQGYEWASGDAFTTRQTNHDKAETCARRDTGCLADWTRETGTTFTHVYVAKVPPKFFRAYNGDDCCWPLRNSLARDRRYTVAYDGPAATIFALRPEG